MKKSMGRIVKIVLFIGPLYEEGLKNKRTWWFQPNCKVISEVEHVITFWWKIKNKHLCTDVSFTIKPEMFIKKVNGVDFDFMLKP